MGNEPVFLTREQIDIIHQEQLNAWGGMPGLRNDSGLESAIAQPLNVYSYGGGDIYEIAAAYAYHIAESQAYLDGNKRQGFRPLWTFSKSTASIPADFRKWKPTKR